VVLSAVEEFRRVLAEAAPDGGAMLAEQTKGLQRRQDEVDVADAEMAAWSSENAEEDRRVERQTKLDEVYLELVEAEPPAASELGIDVSDLLPARAVLVRFSAWVSRLSSELSDLESQRVAYLKAMGVPAQMEAEIKALEEADRSGFLAWRKRGSPVMDRPAVRAFEREQLLEKLKADEWQAKVAIGELDRCEQEIAEKQKTIETIGGRRDGFVKAVAVEAAAPIALEVERLTRAIEAEYAKLLGLSQVVGGDIYKSTQGGIDIDLPKFSVPRIPGEAVKWNEQPGVRLKAKDGSQAAGYWRSAMAMLADNPRAELPAMES
jgi:hypothetical protein